MGTYKGIPVELEFRGNTTKVGDAVKTIDSELKKVDQSLRTVNRSLKLDPSNVTLLTQKFDLISQKTDAAKEKLKTLKATEKEVEEQFKNGRIDQSQWVDFQREIAKTEAELKRARQEASETFKAFSEDLGKNVEDIAAGFQKAAAAVTAITTALGALTVSAAQSADDLNTLSKITGLSTEELQRFQYASSLIDVSQETLSGSLKRLTLNMQSAQNGTGKAAAAFRELGVQVQDTVTGRLRSNKEVFDDVIDALGKVRDETQRDAYAMNIFGKSAQELNPLIIAGSQALEDYGDQAQALGLVFNDQTLDKLNTFNDQLDISKAKFEGMKMLVGSELVDSFSRLFGGVDDLYQLVQQAQKDGTLADIADKVALSVKALVNVLTTAAKFIYEFRREIAAGVTALVAFKAALAITKLIMTLVTGYKTLKAALDAGTVSQLAFNGALSANPIGLVAAALTAAAAGFSVYVNSIDVTAEATARLSEKTREYVQQTDQLTSAVRENLEGFDKEITGLEDQAKTYDSLIDKVYELADKENKSAAEKQQLLAYIDQLNAAVPNLNLSFEDTTNALNMQRSEVESLIEAYDSYIKLQARVQQGIELEKSKNDLSYQYEDAEKKFLEAQKRVEELRKKLKDAASGTSGTFGEDLERQLDQAEDELAAYSLAYAGLGDQLRKVEDRYNENQKAIEDLSSVTADHKAEIDRLTETDEEAVKAAQAFTQAQKTLGEGISSVTDKASQSVSRLSAYINMMKSLGSGIRGVAAKMAAVVTKRKAAEDTSPDTTSTSEKPDTTDYHKQAAEEEMDQAEYEYKTGLISAREYYERLRDINRRYYQDKAEYLEEYRKLEEKTYEGLAKAQEEELSNAKELEDRLEAVRKAQQELERASSQQVQVYSAAAGFHSEKNSAAIGEAQSALDSSKLSLTELLMKLTPYQMGESLSDRLSRLDVSSVRSLLPDLSALSLPTAQGNISNSTAVDNSQYTSRSSVTYAPQIIIQGSVDEATLARLRAVLREDFEKFMEEYLLQSTRQQQTETGG